MHLGLKPVVLREVVAPNTTNKAIQTAAENVSGDPSKSLEARANLIQTMTRSILDETSDFLKGYQGEERVSLHKYYYDKMIENPGAAFGHDIGQAVKSQVEALYPIETPNWSWPLSLVFG